MYHPNNIHDLRFYSSFRRNAIPKIKQKSRFAERSGLFKNSYNWEWYEPPEHSAPVHFFLNTSLHGLRYLGQREKHLCERIFWFIAFTAAVITSAVFIWKMWDAYQGMPIVTVFSPTEKLLSQIPFPAITFCSVSSIKQSKWDEYEQEAWAGYRGEISNDTYLRRLANILDVYHICYSAKTFSQKFYNETRNRDELRQAMWNLKEVYRPFLDPVGTLINASQSCDEMILFCLWLDKPKNCSELFKPIATDYGLCCSFNMLPLTLLRTYVKKHNYEPDLVRDWEDAGLNYENLILDNEHQYRKYPYTQLYAGRSAGLSFLVDPDMAEYHCTITDSEGFVVGLNVPLDFPRMRDNGIAVRTGTEVFISVHPELTLSAESTKTADLDKRHCYFEGEKKLTFYKKYTPSNCMDECIAKMTLRECKCIRYYMPTSGSLNDSLKVCRPSQYGCIDAVKAKMIQKGVDNECDNCWPACTEILYHSEVTSLRIRQSQVEKLFQYHPNKNFDMSKANNVSIVHIYFNMDSVFPRLRKEMTTIIDLISSAGGLLGLCMGFSMLSLLEILYHATIRLLCKTYRERWEANNVTIIDTDTMDPHQSNQSFLSKVIPRGSIVQNFKNGHRQDFIGDDFHKGTEKRIFFKSSLPHSPNLPAFYRPPFEEDFQRAHVATRAPNGVNDAYVNRYN